MMQHTAPRPKIKKKIRERSQFESRCEGHEHNLNVGDIKICSYSRLYLEWDQN